MPSDHSRITSTHPIELNSQKNFNSSRLIIIRSIVDLVHSHHYGPKLVSNTQCLRRAQLGQVAACDFRLPSQYSNATLASAIRTVDRELNRRGGSVCQLQLETRSNVTDLAEDVRFHSVIRGSAGRNICTATHVLCIWRAAQFCFVWFRD